MIRPALKSDALSIAILHQSTLTNSFLAKLGNDFLKSLYTFLIKNDLVIVYEEKKIVKGFVSFSYNSSDTMRRFLFSNPGNLFRLIKIVLLSPYLVKRSMETFFAPFKSRVLKSQAGRISLPPAELLSISVAPKCQQSGIGSQLLQALESQLILNKIDNYKVIAGVSLISANKFYIRNGFIFKSQLTIHGNELSNVYLKRLL